MQSPEKRFQFIPFFIHILIPMIFGALGGFITVRSVKTWYPGIAKPSFNPPNWLFGPVWSVLFLLMGIAAYLVWQKRAQIKHFPRTAAIYFIQLILNLMWSFLFFYTHLIGAALIEIITLLAVIVINGMVFYKIDKTAGLLFIPYFLWVSFAAILNYNIYILNQV
ncbi:tryptophan-rich sensory protein [Pedobacter sp. MC2016-15]|uniref:TspO/MBR family protein n=1 Tax=Pedobacter sp. MC2016-15 TaxID=2994473 RepID=UPI00224722E1|nr:TspO/MBR family protein [Pedobacter sp. MC2016-15]MCX2480002.1 tryptophan-rich sensory protein [Pedobacter sp. MC2016-15]